jgi:desulfoferrodoxin (superoxide reductase-like protein)
MNRRAFLGLVGATAVATPACTLGVGDAPEPTSGVTDPAWEIRATQLEQANGIFTAAAPGMWAGKEATHVPSVAFNADGSVTVSTTHGVAEDHWITTIFVRDQRGDVIHLKEFVGRGTGVVAAATTTFTPRAGTTSITAYAYCNKHDLWADVERPLQ